MRERYSESMLRKAMRCLLFVVVCSCSTIALDAAVIQLRVDATEASRKLYRAQLVIPVDPGPLTLVYPKWIPGEHGPTGPVIDLAGIQITAAGKALRWSRDLVDMYAFHLVVPDGVRALDVALEFLATADAGGFSSAASSTTELMVLSWNQLVLYPEGQPTDRVEVSPELQLPDSWAFGTALPMQQAGEHNTVQFRNVSLTTLVDSPVLAGRHFRRIDLSPGQSPAHYLDIAADSERALDASPELIARYRRLVQETLALFGSTHYHEYHFLLALSDQIAHFGLEHHESSDDQTHEAFLIDDVDQLVGASLLPHEFVHSWNGKFRRPQGLATADFQTPMKGDLLWVYEGLTEYLGIVLTARSGLMSPEQTHQYLALTLAALDHRSGRKWRSLQDTAVAAQLLYNSRSDWDSERRGTDFYDEGALIWLDVDTTMRRLSGGRKSIEDFVRLFHGGTDGPDVVKPYTFDNLTEVLNNIVPNDWKNFFDVRLNQTGTDHVMLNGLENGGYRLSYSGTMSDLQRAFEAVSGNTGEEYSLGLRLNADGGIIDVLPEMPAGRSGLGPGMKLVAVNGRQYNSEVLRDELSRAAAGSPLDLTVQNNRRLFDYKIEYSGGPHYPVLQPNGQPTLLDRILEPLADRR